MINLARIARVFSVVFIGLALVAGNALAAEGASFSLRPTTPNPEYPQTTSYFILDATPGTVIHDTVTITNKGDAPGTARIFAVDGLTAQTTGIVYGDADDTPTGVGAWITLDQSEVTLEPGESQTVGFTIAVPEGAPAEHHVGGIGVQGVEAREATPQAGVAIKVQTRVISAVQVNVPGPLVEQVNVSGIASEVKRGRHTLTLGLSNDGTRMVKPKGTLTIAGSDGQVIREIPLEMNTFLPRTAIDYPIAIPDAPLAAGDYTATLDLTYGTAGHTREELGFSVTAAQAQEVKQAEAAAAEPAADSPASEMTLWLLGAALAGGLVVGLSIAGSAFMLARRRLARSSAVMRPTRELKPLIPRQSPATKGGSAGNDRFGGGH